MLSAAGPGVRGPEQGWGQDLARCKRLGTPLAGPVAVSPFCHPRLCVAATGGGGMGTHRGSSNLPGANISITRPPAPWPPPGRGGAFGRREVRMASDAARSQFSGMEAAGISFSCSGPVTRGGRCAYCLWPLPLMGTMPGGSLAG